MRIFALAALIACFAFSASAATIVMDDFESYGQMTVATPGTFGPWTVTAGSVDVNSAFPGITCHQGIACLDMAGNTNNGTIEHDFSFTAGLTYTLTFWASGNQRNIVPDSMTVMLGTSTLDLTNVAWNDPWAEHTLTFSPVTSGVEDLTFAHSGTDTQGILVDSVSLVDNSQIPEPATLGMIGAGLGALGLLRRRRSVPMA